MTDQTFFNIATLSVAALVGILSYRVHVYNKQQSEKQDYGEEIEELTEALERLREALERLRLNLASNGERISRLEATSEISWRILEVYAGKTLHRHNDSLSVDYYLDKRGELTEEEAQGFIYCLHNIGEDKSLPDGTRLAAAIKLAAVVRHYEYYHLVAEEGIEARDQKKGACENDPKEADESQV